MAKRETARPSGKGTQIGVWLQPDQLAALDAWIDRHDDPKPSRPEAMRQILAGALGAYSPSSVVPNTFTSRDIFD